MDLSDYSSKSAILCRYVSRFLHSHIRTDRHGVGRPSHERHGKLRFLCKLISYLFPRRVREASVYDLPVPLRCRLSAARCRRREFIFSHRRSMQPDIILVSRDQESCQRCALSAQYERPSDYEHSHTITVSMVEWSMGSIVGARCRHFVHIDYVFFSELIPLNAAEQYVPYLCNHFCPN